MSQFVDVANFSDFATSSPTGSVLRLDHNARDVFVRLVLLAVDSNTLISQCGARWSICSRFLMRFLSICTSSSSECPQLGAWPSPLSRSLVARAEPGSRESAEPAEEA